MGYGKEKGDILALNLVSEDENQTKAAVLCALEEFETMGLIKKTTLDKTAYYILKKPLQAYEQNVVIPVSLATSIAAVVNAFCDQIQDDTDRCDPSKITMKDISSVTLIASHLMSKLSEAAANKQED